MVPPTKENLKGQVFTRLTVLGRTTLNQRTAWNFPPMSEASDFRWLD